MSSVAVEKTVHGFIVKKLPDPPTPADLIEQLEQENADLAFNLMLVEVEAQTARQEVADLNFQLMVNGVI